MKHRHFIFILKECLVSDTTLTHKSYIQLLPLLQITIGINVSVLCLVFVCDNNKSHQDNLVPSDQGSSTWGTATSCLGEPNVR